MITLHPTKKQIKEALADAKSMGILYGSFTHGRGNGIGMLAEIVCRDYLNALRVSSKNYSHDLELDGYTIDVKAKRCSSEPKPEYTASVLDKNGQPALKAERVLFTRVVDDFSTVYIVGWLSKRQFSNRAEFVAAGTRDGGFINRVSGWHVPISRLNKIEKLVSSSLSESS